MTYRFSQRSKDNMVGVHPDLIRVVTRALQLTAIDFTVLEGVRSFERQEEMVAIGASHTMRSRHLTGHAVDLGACVGGRILWDWPLYHKIASAMKQAAKELGVEITWGGDWRRFKDGPHFQLSWSAYKAG